MHRTRLLPLATAAVMRHGTRLAGVASSSMLVSRVRCVCTSRGLRAGESDTHATLEPPPMPPRTLVKPQNDAAAATVTPPPPSSTPPPQHVPGRRVCPPAESIFASTRCDFEENLARLERNEPLTLPTLMRTAKREDEIFSNADLPLAHINAYGFDYDYTLASYNHEVGRLIYQCAQRYLVDKMGYPAELLSHEFDQSFAIRGLHFDTRTGWLLKVDQFGKVQTSTVHKGRRRVPVSDIVAAYRGTSLTEEYRRKHLYQLVDLFALSETNLLADTVQTFVDRGIDASPDYIHRDIRKAIDHVHSSGELHGAIIAEPGRFLEIHQSLAAYLLKLREAGKLTFLLTNSPFAFVDAGMRFMLRDIASLPGAAAFGIRSGADWRELFDITICSARKPTFFTREGSFRRIDPSTGALSWRPVSEFRRGEVYTEGSLSEFSRLTGLLRPDNVPGLRGHNVLYMGDHIAADLTAPWQAAKWRTVAIVRELEFEIQVQQTAAFKNNLQQLLRIEALIDYGQKLDDNDSMQEIMCLKDQRSEIKKTLLEMFNPHFGSAFRTSSNRTEFFFSVSRYADVYTSSISNFLNYSLRHCFYASRNFFPNELPFSASRPPEQPPVTPVIAHRHAPDPEEGLA